MTHAVFHGLYFHAGMRKESYWVGQKVLHGHQHVVTLAQARMRQLELCAVVLFSLDPAKVTVYGPRAMSQGFGISFATEGILDLQEIVQQNERMELRMNLGHRVGHRRGYAIGRLGLVRLAYGSNARKGNLVYETCRLCQVFHAIAHV